MVCVHAEASVKYLAAERNLTFNFWRRNVLAGPATEQSAVPRKAQRDFSPRFAPVGRSQAPGEAAAGRGRVRP